ncbi:hypothetical protein DF186_19610, partial [Enterococcus hirae]
SSKSRPGPRGQLAPVEGHRHVRPGHVEAMGELQGDLVERVDLGTGGRVLRRDARTAVGDRRAGLVVDTGGDGDRTAVDAEALGG